MDTETFEGELVGLKNKLTGCFLTVEHRIDEVDANEGIFVGIVTVQMGCGTTFDIYVQADYDECVISDDLDSARFPMTVDGAFAYLFGEAARELSRLRDLASQFVRVAMSGDEARLLMVISSGAAMSNPENETGQSLHKRCDLITEIGGRLRSALIC